jgi:hypothetical protein
MAQITLNSSGVASNGSLLLQSNGTTTAVTIDTAQNMGLGVTPPTSTDNGNLTIKGSNTFNFSTASGSIAANATWNGGWKYISTAAASLYAQAAGTHAWSVASSGTAGNTISFTQAMTLDASGNLGIGTSSPAQKMDVNGNISFAQTTNAQSLIVGNLSNTTYGKVVMGRNSYFVAGATTGITFNDSTDTKNLFIISNGAPNGAMTLDSSGNLLVGTTDANPNSGTGVKINAGTGARTSVVGSADTNANFALTVYSTSPSAYRFQVGYGGTIYATSTSITAISDASLKTNVRDLETGLTEVMALQPRRFDWINGDASNVAGFIAQEVKQVLPDLVEDYQYSDEETKLGLKMGDILPTLVKAIQEQQALITTLTDRITALEAK